MEKDSLFLIGDSHKVCQDYALTGDSGGIDFLIVSDGCSSSKDSDLGARFLCLLAKQFVSILFDKNYTREENYRRYGHMIIRMARSVVKQLDLSDNCLDATLLVCATDGEDILVVAYGDGNIIGRSLTDNAFCFNIKFCSGAPYYLSYWDDLDRQRAYKERFDGDLILSYDGPEDRVNYYHPLIFDFKVNSCRSISILSDGLESFASRNSTVLKPYQLLIDPLTSFKTTKGEFLKRRVERCIKDLEKTEDIVHHDDFSMASLVFER